MNPHEERELDGMNTRDILGRFTSGELSKSEALALMRSAGAGGAASAAGSGPAAASGPVGSGSPAAPQEPVAVIGCSARFPGAPDLDAFRQVIREGRDTVSEVPPDRWPAERWYDADPAAPGRSLSRWGGLVEDAAAFDAEQFRMTPREAELTDPQARLFLQECFRAVENAGYAPSALAGTRCGVYAGVMLNDYAHRIERSSPHSRLPQVMQGNSQSILAARVAYLLDLAGPVTAVDTACSSSLVALHQACQALWLGEADMMLAGGVTLYTTELPYIYMSKAGMLSPTGRCRPFDASADGFVPGEGSAVVLLKPLSRAMADGDPVQLVIRASGVNHDGFTNGLTAPSPRAQSTLVRDVYSRFGIDPATIDYVECHGTGTPLGDPIEVSALNDAFADAGLPAGHIPVGSVKGNVGHTSAAAGLAGLFKALEVVTSGQVPPSLHFTRPNPRIPFGQGPFRVASGPESLPLPDGSGRPWRAAVSSFGLSGTNAHVVVEAPPAREPDTTAGPALVVLSARDRDLLTAQARALAGWLAGPGSGAGVHEVARTLALGRSHGPGRLAVVAQDCDELRSLLESFTAGRPDEQWAASTADSTEGDRVRQAQEPLLERLYEQLSSPGPAARDDLLALGRLYAQQHDVDWRRIHPAGGPRAVALPGSVLATERYWVEEHTAAGQAPVPAPIPAARDASHADAAVDVPPAARRNGTRPTDGTDLVKDDNSGADGASLAASDGRDAGGVPELPGTSLYIPQWQSQPVGPAAAAPGTLLLLAPPPGTRSGSGAGSVEDLRTALAAAWSGPVRLVGPGGEETAAAADPSAYPADEPVTLLVTVRAGDPSGSWWAPLFGPVRELLTRLWKRQVQLVAVAEDRTSALAAAGFVQTLAHENPRLTGRAVLMDRLDPGPRRPAGRGVRRPRSAVRPHRRAAPRPQAAAPPQPSRTRGHGPRHALSAAPGHDAPGHRRARRTRRADRTSPHRAVRRPGRPLREAAGDLARGRGPGGPRGPRDGRALRVGGRHRHGRGADADRRHPLHGGRAARGVPRRRHSPGRLPDQEAARGRGHRDLAEGTGRAGARRGDSRSRPGRLRAVRVDVGSRGQPRPVRLRDRQRLPGRPRGGAAGRRGTRRTLRPDALGRLAAVAGRRHVGAGGRADHHARTHRRRTAARRDRIRHARRAPAPPGLGARGRRLPRGARALGEVARRLLGARPPGPGAACRGFRGFGRS